jgi:hypothetical protein
MGLAIVRVLSLQMFFTLLLDRHMVPDGTAGDRAHNRVMMREVTGDTADDSAFEASCLGGCDICTAHGQYHWDDKDVLRHFSLLVGIAVPSAAR